MRTSRLFWKLLAVFGIVSGAMAALLAVIWLGWQRSSETALRRELLESLAYAVRSDLPPVGPSQEHQRRALADYLARWSRQDNVYATVIDADGQVLASSAGADEPGTDLSSRPEVLQALHRGHVGEAQRWNGEVGRRIHYLAVPLVEDDRVVGTLRIGVDAQSWGASQSIGSLTVWGTVALLWLTGMAGTYVWLARAVDPLERLARRAQAIAAGDEPADTTYLESDEIGLLGAAIDDMRAKRAGGLLELREKTDLLVSLLGNMVEGVIAIGPDESVLIANTASGRMLGFAAEGASGRSLLEVTRCRPLHEAVLESLRLSRAVNCEFDAAGMPRRVVAVRVAPLAAEPRAGVMVVMHDVTELRRLENLRREFVANVSHELKTPLASIKAYAETLRMGAIDDAEHRMEFVSRIEEQGERLHQLIVDLLHLARVEAGQASFELVEIPVALAAEECFEQFRDAAATRGTGLHLELAAEPLTVVADEEGLSTILSNLVDNAIKYTPAGGEITISWRRDGGYAVLAVRDTGIGIAPRDQARIFERFFRVDKARSRELGGTGLGLSIVKHLAQAFGGDVGLESQPGQGSTFLVRLPLARSTVATQPPRRLSSGS